MVLFATSNSLAIAKLLQQASMIAREKMARLPLAAAVAARGCALNRKFTITQVNVRYDLRGPLTAFIITDFYYIRIHNNQSKNVLQQ